jgi:NAD(P)H-flavin reductase
MSSSSLGAGMRLLSEENERLRVKLMEKTNQELAARDELQQITKELHIRTSDAERWHALYSQIAQDLVSYLCLC